MREAMRQFLIDQMREMAIDRVFTKQSTAGIYECRKVIDKTFDKLEEIYGKIDEAVIDDPR